MPKFLNHVDLVQNELRNVILQNLASRPSTPKVGQIIFNTTAGHQEVCTVGGGSPVWETITSGTGTVTNVSGTAPIQVTNPTTTPSITIDAATGTTPGSMSAADKAKLDAATAVATVSTLVSRDGAGDSAFHEITAGAVHGLSTPASPNDAASKSYVDAAIQGADWHPSVRALATSNLSLAGTQTVDGISLIVGDRVGVIGQTTPTENGIYVVASGSWTRATDANNSTNFNTGAAFFVEEGASNAKTGYILTTANPITLGSTALAFTQFTGLGEVTVSSPLSKTGNTISLPTLPIANGGTGQTTADSARLALGATKQASGNIGDGSSTTIDFAHGLNTMDVIVMVRRNSSPFEVAYPDVQVKDVNTVTCLFSAAPTTNQWRVTVIG